MQTLKQMYDLQTSDRTTHKEAAMKRVKQDKHKIQKLLTCFTSGLMADPFSSHTTDPLNFATGVVLPSDLVDALDASTTKGIEQMSTFIEKRVNKNRMSFWDPVTSLTMKTFETAFWKVHLKAANEKLTTVEADREIFGTLLITDNAQQINLREVLLYALSPILYSLLHQDGSLRKTTKSVMASIVEDGIITLPRLPVEPQYVVYIFDGMALIQIQKSSSKYIWQAILQVLQHHHHAT